MANYIDSGRPPSGVGAPDAAASMCNNPAVSKTLRDMRSVLSDFRPGERLNYIVSADELDQFTGFYDIQLPSTSLKGSSEIYTLQHREGRSKSERAHIHIEGQSSFPGVIVDFAAKAVSHNGKLIVPHHLPKYRRTSFAGRVTEGIVRVATPLLVSEFGALANKVVTSGLRDAAHVEGISIGKDPHEALVFTLQRR